MPKRDTSATTSSSSKKIAKRRADPESEVLSAEESDDAAEPAAQKIAKNEDAEELAILDGINIRVGRGETFAGRVLHVIENIPRGKVAAYGQVAALAGMPRNARQVGKMLGDGLCDGGTGPWHRVLGSSGKISLPPASGGSLQRQRLEAEGVVFRETGAVAPGTFWDRSQPYYSTPIGTYL